MQVDLIFGLIVLIVSVMLHEVAHGVMADYLGDPTARLSGRLTLNPLVHIDPVGSFLLPLFLHLTGSPILLGYAKPVPYNPYNLSGDRDEALVAAAGPLTNLAIALCFGLVLRMYGGAFGGMVTPLASIVYLNLLLAVFNLIPLPPLDGSKVFAELLPRQLGVSYTHLRRNFERLGVLSGTMVVLLVLWACIPFFDAFLNMLFTAITGLAV